MKLSEETLVLATLMRHREHLRLNLQRLEHELAARGVRHDLSKLREDELSGFIDIQRIAREHGIGTPEYEVALRDAPCIHLHFARNSHHPEHWFGEMGWLDIIEMVCDWKAACDTYGTNSLRDSLDYQRERHGFTDAQWWLIMQVVDWIDPQEEAP